MSAMNGVFPTLQNSDALLCYTCKLSLNNINKLKKKIDDLKTRVRDQLSALCKVKQKRHSAPLANQLKTQLPSKVELTLQLIIVLFSERAMSSNATTARSNKNC